MTISDDIDCSVYVDADTSPGDLARSMVDAAIGPMVNLSTDARNATLRGDHFEIEVLKSNDADTLRRLDFPDGFLYFSFKVDIYVDAARMTPEERVRLVDQLLHLFWKNGHPAVAACDYEDQLRLGGGFKSADVPWPKR